MEQTLASLRPNQLLVILSSDSYKRKQIHSYLETHYPKFGKASVYSGSKCHPKDWDWNYDGMPAEVRRATFQCFECPQKISISDSDHKMIEDEYGVYEIWRKDCSDKDCNGYVEVDGYFSIYRALYLEMRNDTIVIGRYVRNYKSKLIPTTLMSTSEMNALKFRIIPAPERQLNRFELGRYIQSRLLE